jgi:multicomponent Na+:H+ antiporter subunit E
MSTLLTPVAALAALFVFWLLLSGMFVPFLVAAGFGSALAVLLLGRRMNAVVGDPAAGGLRWLKFAAYLPWLVKEIIVAAWDVSKRILQPRLPISPTLVEFAPMQASEIGLLIHANSITLTPGTISVEVEPGRFLVHAITAEAGAALAGSEMDRRCAALETGAKS